jgi:hypothetical protein
LALVAAGWWVSLQEGKTERVICSSVVVDPTTGLPFKKFAVKQDEKRERETKMSVAAQGGLGG